MTDRLTDEEIEEIRGRAEAATEGPWDVRWGTYLVTLSREDAEFCEYARTDTPRLLDEVEHWKSRAERLDSDLELAKLLGVEPKSCFTWVKMTDEGVLQKGLGQYSMGSTEHLLLCRRGRFLRPDVRHPTAFFAPRTEHSRKPEKSYEIVEDTSPGGYLEIFARRPRDGWIVWGNEVVG